MGREEASLLEKYRYPMALVLSVVILPFIRTFFMYVDQQGIVHKPGFYTAIVGEILLLLSGIWFVKVYLAKCEREN